METARFVFWEAMKVLSLAFLALLAAKSVATLSASSSEGAAKTLAKLKPACYLVILLLAALGAWNLGYDMAAESYYWASQSNLASQHYSQAYSNALRAVETRPGTLRYWRALSSAKVYLQQADSALADRPALESLSGGKLDEEDAYRYAVCSYFLGRYDDAVAITQQLIQRNPFYPAPCVLQGKSFIAEEKYAEAERTFRALLHFFPDHQAGVEGLAHVYFLSGHRAEALKVLDETAHRPFSPEARQRFEALRSIYVQ